MIAWLSDWLRDIIAVVLLAVFLELIIPGKTMLRYTRLVIGLFILLTIMSPILRLVQGDINAKLDEGMRIWSDASSFRAAEMPSLSQIQEKAAELNAQREQEAAALAERTLETAMQAELEERIGKRIDSVDAELKWVQQKGGQIPYLNGVTVTLLGADPTGQLPDDKAAVKDVAPVSISVELNTSGDKAESGGTAEQPQWEQAEPALQDAIRSAIAQNWGADPSRITVRQPAPSKDGQ